MKTIQSRVVVLLGLMAMAFLWAGCTSTSQMRKAEPSGFLGDYSQFQKGGKDEALLVYLDPKADLSSYTKILLDPVGVYAGTNGTLAKLPKEDLQNMVNYLDATLREHLKADYQFVTEPGPGVIRLRAAITEAKGARVGLDTFSTLMPIGLAVSGIKKLATGSHSAVGYASMEIEGLDSVTKTRLFAGVDSRTGSKFTGKFDKFRKYRTTEDSFDYWAERLQKRLAEERNKGQAK